jgi:hypothetical protein
MCCDAQRITIREAAGRQMSASGASIMQDTFSVRNGPRSGGFVTIGTMILAAV